MLGAGDRDTKITIESPTYSRNGYGESIASYAELTKAWVKWEPQSTKESTVKESGATEETIKATMLFNANVNTKCRVKKGSDYYNIVSIIDRENAHRELELTVVRQS